MKTIILATTALASAFWLASLPGLAEVTSLECTMLEVRDLDQSPGKPLKAEITLNESEQTASLVIPATGFTKRLGATFDQTLISLKIFESGTEDSWSIKRTDGSMLRELTPTDRGVALVTFRWEGSCKNKN